jgi:hypothetical protein
MSGLMAENSAIQVTPEIEAALKQAASHEEMKGILAQAAVDQLLVTRDAVNPSILLPSAAGSPSRAARFAKVITVNGSKHVLEGSTEAELVHKENELLRATFAGQPTDRNDQPARDAQGRFTADQGKADEAAALDVAGKEELARKYQLGLISMPEYIEASGAISEYLEKRGIDIETLKTTVTEKQESVTVRSWQQAVDDFLTSPAGADWPGSSGSGQESNLETIQKIIVENGLESSPSVEVLAQCWDFMKQNNLVKPNKEVEARDQILGATNFEDIRTAARGGSSLFGVN